jgi:hypothetical protein
LGHDGTEQFGLFAGSEIYIFFQRVTLSHEIIYLSNDAVLFG